jgi:hypothetical protein
VHGGRKFSQFVIDFMVEHERIEDIREDTCVALECLGDRLGGALSDGAIGLVELGEGLIERQFLRLFAATELHCEPRDELAEEPLEGTGTRIRFYI